VVKVDIKSAYRIAPIHPEDCHLLDMRWDGSLYVDTSLSLGLPSALKIFTVVADMAEWITKQKGEHVIIHYMVDYRLLSNSGRTLLDNFLATLDTLRLSLAPKKLEGPTTKLTFSWP